MIGMIALVDFDLSPPPLHSSPHVVLPIAFKPLQTSPAVTGEHGYLSNAALCVVCAFRRVKDHHKLSCCIFRQV